MKACSPAHCAEAVYTGAAIADFQPLGLSEMASAVSEGAGGMMGDLVDHFGLQDCRDSRGPLHDTDAAKTGPVLVY